MRIFLKRQGVLFFLFLSMLEVRKIYVFLTRPVKLPSTLYFLELDIALGDLNSAFSISCSHSIVHCENNEKQDRINFFKESYKKQKQNEELEKTIIRTKK